MSARRFGARSIEAIAKALGDTEEGLTNAEIDDVARSCRFPPEEPGTKWTRIFNILVRDQNSRRDRTGIFAFIRSAMRPAIYVKAPNRFETLRQNLNRALLFEGLALEQDGKLVSAKISVTINDARRRAAELRSDLEQRNVHPDILAFCKEEFLADNYFHAVLEATKSLAQKLRDRTGMVEDGAALIDGALSGSDPRLKINNFLTESEKSEQKGFATLCKGLIGMFRNPTAHAPKVIWKMDKEDAADLMSTLSLIHRRLDKARL